MSLLRQGSALRLLRRLAGACAFSVAALAGAQTPTPTEPPRFEVRRFAVEGNSVLSPEAVEAVLAPHTGGGRSFADVQAAVDALQRVYARTGFGAVEVALPEQSLADGVVRIVVVEPPLGTVTIEGNSHFDSAGILRTLPALRRGATPNTEDLAAQIRLANENPARRLSVELKRDPGGSIEATVTVRDDKPWKIGAVVDNTGTPSTGRVRTGVFFQHANVAGRGHVLTGQYMTSPDYVDEVTIAGVNYRIPIPAFGDAIDFYAAHADVDSGIVSELFTVRGRGSVAGVRYLHNLTPTARLQHRLVVGYERRTFDNRVGMIDGAPDLLPDIAVHPASLGYAASWAGERLQFELGTTAVRNIPGQSNGGSTDFEAARSGAGAGYSLLRWTLGATTPLPGDWQLRLAGDGQATRYALVEGEQFGIGGQDSVRGFYEREFSNDRGWRASIELRGPDFGARLGPGVSAQALVFHDRGHVSRNLALPGELASVRIASVGVGLRISLAPSLTARLDLARVTRGAGVHANGAERAHFSVGIAY